MNKKLIISAVLICLLLAFAAVMAFGQNSPNVRWEYHRYYDRNATDAQDMERANQLGAQGWELVTYVNGQMIFKRRAQ